MCKLRFSSPAGRRRLVVVLSFLAAVSFLLGYAFLWVTDTVIDSRRFAEITTQALTSEQVRDAVAGAVVDKALENSPIIQEIVRRPLEAAISGLLGTALFADVLSTTASEIHLLITTGTRDKVVLRVGQAHQIIYGIVEAINQTAVESLPPPGSVSEVVFLTKDAVKPVRVAANVIPFVAAGLLVIGFALFAFALWKAENSGRIVRATGFQLFFGSLLVLIIVPIARIALTGGMEKEVPRVVVDQAYRALTSNLVVRMWILVVFALILVALGYRLVRRRRLALEGIEPGPIFSGSLSRLWAQTAATARRVVPHKKAATATTEEPQTSGK